MKALLPLLCLLTSMLLANPQIQVGDNFEQAIESLGKPIGTIELREKTLLLYPRGEVTLKHDKIIAIDLMTEEQFAADQKRLQEERQQWADHQAKMAAQRKQQGEALKAEKIKSTSFSQMSAKDKVDYWRRFQHQYPEVDVSVQIAAALETYQQELDELKNQQRIAELEARVARAESEAAAARLETERLRKETEQARKQANYGLRYYTTPAVHPHYYYRPPTVTIYSDGNVTKVPRNHSEHCPSADARTTDGVRYMLNRR